jgi:hypothetical protein
MVKHVLSSSKFSHMDACLGKNYMEDIHLSFQNGSKACILYHMLTNERFKSLNPEACSFHDFS